MNPAGEVRIRRTLNLGDQPTEWAMYGWAVIACMPCRPGYRYFKKETAEGENLSSTTYICDYRNV
jgi:hypothetical protein